MPFLPNSSGTTIQVALRLRHLAFKKYQRGCIGFQQRWCYEKKRYFALKSDRSDLTCVVQDRVKGHEND